MSKRPRTVALLSVTAGLLFVAAFALIYREEIKVWVRGYRVNWLEEGVAPESMGKLWERSQYVSLTLVDEDGKPQEGAPTDRNSRHEMVGWIVSREFGGRSRAYLSTRGDGRRDLGELVNGGESVARALNEHRWVVGEAKAADGLDHPFLWRSNSGMMDLGLPSVFVGGYAVDINDSGEVLVNLNRKGLTQGNSTDPLATPFLWIEGRGYVELPFPPGYATTRGVAINNDGHVLMEAGNPPDRATTGYLVIHGRLRRLPNPGEAGYTRWWDLTDAGWIIGTAGLSSVERDSRLPRGIAIKLTR